MKKLTILMILIIAVQLMLAQTNKTDSLLFKAVKENNLEQVKKLILKGADVNVKDSIYSGKFHDVTTKDTPLHYASKEGHLKIAKLLIKNGANINVKGNYNETPLHYASENKHLEIAKLLIESGANVNVKNTYSNNIYHLTLEQTPLFLAINNDDFKMVKLLVENGANINIKDNEGKTPLQYASTKDKLKITKLLIENSADINIKGGNGETPLHYAIEYGEIEVIKLFVEKGANVNIKNNNGATPLHYSIKYGGDIEIAKLLIEKGADINIKDNEGNTPLHYASKKGRFDIVKLLLEKGVAVNVKNYNNNTPLYYASRNGHIKIEKLLIEKGADINIKDKNEKAFLHYASMLGQVEIVKLLINKGASVNIKDSEGKTPLHNASENGRIEVVKLLISKGANINSKDNKGKTPLNYAIGYDKFEIAKFIINKKANVNIKDNNGKTPLHYASEYGQQEIVKLLIEKGADVNIQDNDGNTALHIIISSYRFNYNYDIIKMLKHTNLNLKNKNDKTILQIINNLYELDKYRVIFALEIKQEPFKGNALMRNKLVVYNQIPISNGALIQYKDTIYYDYYLNNNLGFNAPYFFSKYLQNKNNNLYKEYNPYPSFNTKPLKISHKEVKERLNITDTTLFDETELKSITCYDEWYFDEIKFEFKKTTEAYAPVRQYKSEYYNKTKHTEIAYIIPKPFKNNKERLKSLKRSIPFQQIKYEVELENKDCRFDCEYLDLSDMTEPTNSPYLNSFARNKLRSIIVDAAVTGKRYAYDFNTGKLISKELLPKRLGKYIDTTYNYNEWGEAEPIRTLHPVDIEEIKSLIFIENWRIDTVSMHIHKEVIGIAPVRTLRTYYLDEDWNNKIPIKTIPFAIYFNDYKPNELSSLKIQTYLPFIKKQYDFAFNQNNIFEAENKGNFDFMKNFVKKIKSKETKDFSICCPKDINSFFDSRNYSEVSDEYLSFITKFADTSNISIIKTNEIWRFNRNTYSFTKDIFSYKPIFELKDTLRSVGYLLNNPDNIDISKMLLFKTVKYEHDYNNLDSIKENFTDSTIQIVEKNKPLFYSNYHQKKFKEMLMEDVLSGKIKCYDYKTNKKIKLNKLNEKLKIDTKNDNIDAIWYCSSNNIKSLIFTEDWYVNPKTMQIKKVVREIAPVFYNNKKGKSNKEFSQAIPFYIKINK